MSEEPKTWGPVERETLISALQVILKQIGEPHDMGTLTRLSLLHDVLEDILLENCPPLDTPEARKRIFDIVYPEGS